MSKSNGEFLTVSLLKNKGYSPIDYRYFCLNSHYRNPLTFSFDSLDGARNALTKLKNKISNLKEEGSLDNEQIEKYNNKFVEAISNDLNTSSMVTVLYDLLKDEAVNDNTKRELIKKFDTVLSLDLLNVDVVEIDEELEKEINEFIAKRAEAKKNKDFALADQIRDELLERNIKLIDTREGTKFEIIKD